ncbi:MAG: phage terminase large subunit [Leptospiraceae bacterium]|nr:phage terminase large subunit [Leptospiraceae bacterium]
MNIKKLELIDALYALESRDDFWVYRQYMNPDLKISWFQKEIAYELMEFYRKYKLGLRPKLVIEAPPQHGKSSQVIDFISWLAGQDPNSKTIYTSFSERLGIRANLRLQRIFDSDKFKKVFPETKINSKNSVAVSGQVLRNREILEYVGNEGYFRNVTSGGSITGESLDIGVIDDILKGAEESQSQLIRDKKWDWFTDDFLTRFSDDGALIVIGTRWHIDDPIGRMREQFKDLRVLSYQAIADKDEKNRKAGEALFPSHKSVEFLLERKQIMNPLSWLALYQANPTLAKGNLFNRDTFRYYTYDNGIITIDGTRTDLTQFKVYQIVDPAGTEKKNSDYFVVMTIGVSAKNSDIIILDIRREKAETPKHLEILQSEFEKWKPINQYVENKSFGINIIQAFKNTNRPVLTLEAKGDKPTRAQITLGYYANSKVYHRQSASWLSDFEEELLQFPYGLHDDMVDCIAYAGIITQSMATQFQFLRIGADGVKR